MSVITMVKIRLQSLRNLALSKGILPMVYRQPPVQCSSTNISTRFLRTQTREQVSQQAQAATTEQTTYSPASLEDIKQEEFLNAKPFSAIPGPYQLPFIYNLYEIPYVLWTGKSHYYDIGLQKKYGDVVLERFGPNDSDTIVKLFSAKDVEKLHRYDGLLPRRITLQPWQEWRDEVGLSRGVVTEDGEKWLRMRILLNRQMLRPRDVASYCSDLSAVATDFLDRIRKVRDPGTQAVEKLDMELFHWSLESIGLVVYETRFGGLSENRSGEQMEFIQAVRTMFKTTGRLFYLPRAINMKFQPATLKKHETAWETIFERGRKEVDRKLKEIQTQLKEGKEVTGFLSTLLASGKMSEDEVYANMTELMTGGVDTTASTMQFALYELSVRPELQRRVRDEVLSITPRGTVPTYGDIQKMTYLKGFIKEILRLYPIAQVCTRITNEDMVLGGYQIPANTRVTGIAYHAGRNPDYFEDPEELKPERWQRNTDHERAISHPYAFMAFGFRQRMCLGRRVAELEMHLLTSMMLQEFDIISADRRPMETSTVNLVLTPERPVSVRFVDRKRV